MVTTRAALPRRRKEVMYTMFAEWRCDIRYKMALSCLHCEECAGWRPESGMKLERHAE